jgi:Tfp pilus assembly protein PilZ
MISSHSKQIFYETIKLFMLGKEILLQVTLLHETVHSFWDSVRLFA